MARTKSAARKSADGKAPRKQRDFKVARKTAPISTGARVEKRSTKNNARQHKQLAFHHRASTNSETETMADTEIMDDAVPSQTSKTHLRITHRAGDLFTDVTPNTLLVHSCNSLGVWGSGVAAQFRQRYPGAYQCYHEYCLKHKNDPGALVGKAMIIWSSLDNGDGNGKGDELGDGDGDGDEDEDAEEDDDESETVNGGCWIGVLFVREGYGAPTAKEEAEEGGYEGAALRATEAAMTALIRGIQEEVQEAEAIGEVRMPRINAGLFGIPWEMTEEILRGVEVCEGVGSSVVVFDG